MVCVYYRSTVYMCSLWVVGFYLALALQNIMSMARLLPQEVRGSVDRACVSLLFPGNVSTLFFNHTTTRTAESSPMNITPSSTRTHTHTNARS